MKKVFLSFFIAALFGVGAFAQVQEQDTTSASPNLRGDEQREQTDMEAEENQQREPSQQLVEVPEVEVLEEKEGPDAQVVYKHNDEVFYVDRDEGKLVKVEESELQDAKHDIIIKGPMSESDNNTKRNKSKDDNRDEQP